VVTFVEQHVDERAPNDEWAAQWACMVAFGEHAPATPMHAIDGAREANAEALHAAR